MNVENSKWVNRKSGLNLSERIARWLIIAIALMLPLAVMLYRWLGPRLQDNRAIEIHARMPETGGWTPANLVTKVGEPLRLRLISDDVVHSFAIGQSDFPAVDIHPGEVTETTLSFDRPGKYTFYCTRWCGPNHWRMRGTIEVTASEDAGLIERSPDNAQPLYQQLGLDIDAPHLARVTPEIRPSAGRGAALEVEIPAMYLSTTYYRSHTPVEIWQAMRSDPFTKDLSDSRVWDLVALVWQKNTSPEKIDLGQALFSQNCAACHGESGAGDGVMAPWLGSRPDDIEHTQAVDGHSLAAPTDFTDPGHMLGASPALLQGKIMRGGMGTGMPYWGPVFTEEQVWALVDSLWTFQFEME